MSRDLWLFDDAPIVAGAEVFALRLGRYLAHSGGPKLKVICPPGEMSERCAAAGIEYAETAYPPMGPTGVPRWPGAIWAIRGLLEEARNAGAVIVANTARAQAYVFAASRGMWPPPNVVQIVHERDTLARISGRFAYRRGGALVAMGGRIAKICREKLPGVEVREANLFLDWHDLKRNPANVPAGEDPVLGVLARFIDGKGQLALVEELARAGGWSRAILAGPNEDEEYTARVRERISELGLGSRIEVRGRVEDTDAFFAEVEVLMVPSTGSFEGQGFVIIEGLAQNRPAMVRRQAFSPGDYDHLPVFAYEGAQELEQRLRELPRETIDLDLVRKRFGADQALATILAAADRSSPPTMAAS